MSVNASSSEAFEGWGPCHGSDIDFVEITETTPADLITRARAMCASCPLLIGCLRYLEGHDVAGFAGGMFEAQRKAWQDRNDYEVPVVTMADVSEANELRGAILDGLPATRGELKGTGDARLTPEAVNVVLRMTRAGFAAQEIVDRLNNPHITRRTVNYLRYRYRQSPPSEVVVTRMLVGWAQQKAG